jgi:hypothetical protein
VRRRYVEEYDFVRARGAVRCREFGRIASITQVQEFRSFHHAASVNVEAGDNSFRQHLKVAEIL